METSFDEVKYTVPAEQAAATVRGDDATNGLRARIHELVGSHVDGDPGFFVLSGMADLDAEEAGAFTVSVSEMVGRLLPQDAKGTLLREVVDRGVKLGEGKTGRYSDSRQGGNLHTDGPHALPPVPDSFGLYCVHQAEVGGELCLIHVDDLIERLPASAVEILSSDFHFDRREDGVEDPTVVRPILSRTPEGARICYLREYVELGHGHDHVPSLTPEQRDALDRLDALLDDPELQTRGRLEPGEMAVINNRSLLHGRTAFEDDASSGDKRLMLRTWIQRPEPARAA